MTQRGDLVTVSLQGGFGKPRTALVVQSDLLTDLGNVLLCPVTSDPRNTAFRVTVEQNPSMGCARFHKQHARKGDPLCDVPAQLRHSSRFSRSSRVC